MQSTLLSFWKRLLRMVTFTQLVQRTYDCWGKLRVDCVEMQVLIRMWRHWLRGVAFLWAKMLMMLWRTKEINSGARMQLGGEISALFLHIMFMVWRLGSCVHCSFRNSTSFLAILLQRISSQLLNLIWSCKDIPTDTFGFTNIGYSLFKVSWISCSFIV